MYHIIYSAETRAFDRWLKTAKHMIESLELSSSGSINGSYDTRVFSDWLTTELPVPMSVNPLTNMIYTVNDFSDGIDVNTFENAEIQLLDSQPIPISEPSGITVDTVATFGRYKLRMD